MGSRRLVALALLVVVGGIARADDPPDAGTVERTRAEMALLARIPEVVARGRDWLLGRQRFGGSFVAAEGGRISETAHHAGRTALVVLTLAHCGLRADDPRVVRALRYLRERSAETRHGRPMVDGPTYSTALTLMALHELYAAPGAGRDPTPDNPLGLPGWARRLVGDDTAWLLASRAKTGLFGYPILLRGGGRGHEASDEEDMSNTQFALLGLWAATRCGERVEPDLLASIARHLLDAQAADGPPTRRAPDPGSVPASWEAPLDHARGFTYGPTMRGPVRVTGSMTAGGLSSLLVVKAMLGEAGALDPALAADLDRGIWDALAWLAGHFDADANPLGLLDPDLPPSARGPLGERLRRTWTPPWFGYWLYAIERACVIAGKRRLGTRDWYLEGARALVGTQEEDGAWRLWTRRGAEPYVASQEIVDTCFALLFLQRATLRPRSDLLDPQAGVVPTPPASPVK
jgi:hypothetical protein